MKKILSGTLGLFLGLTSFNALAQGMAESLAQMPPAEAMQLPADSTVRQGVLPNGLTYYIRHNETPKGQADFFIAQKVGSVLEEDNQRGLAHFLEHMCFNGTENFEGNEVVSWLETKGVKFGADLNAYTGVDETVYNISNVPVGNVAVEDSCLLILHDWADGLLLLPEEIDKERGVIHEEWRMRNVGMSRLMEQQLPAMYPDTRYAYRWPIGTMEVVDNFEPQVLRDYYETWYRPDQQGVIVIGDIDVDRIENKIKEMFGPIKMPENVKERVYFEVPDNKGTLYAIGADPEMPNARATLYIKNDKLPRAYRNTPVQISLDYINDMITTMLQARLDELATDPAAPFAAAGTYYGGFFVADTKDALTLVALGKDTNITPALQAVYRELLRAQRGGFTISEYDRAKEEYLSQAEKKFNNRDKRENEEFSRGIVRVFIDGTPMLDPQTEYQTAQQMAMMIPLEAINATLQQMVTPDNRVISVMLPQTEGTVIPTEAELAAALAAVDAEDIKPFVDEVKAEPLIPALPAPGKITGVEKLEKWGAEKWTLSNGATVVVKPTDFKADEILLDAQALGGTSVFGNDYASTLKFMPYALNQYGLGDYTYKDLQKYLQGKQCGISFDFSNYTRDITGHSTPKDLKNMMELLYMGFTALNITADEFDATRNTFSGVLHNQENEPDYIFGKRIQENLYEAPVEQVLSVADIQAAQLAQTLDVAHKMTANAADYTFFIVGSVNLDELRPLVEQYIASLPGNAATAVKTPVMPESMKAYKAAPALTESTIESSQPQTYVFTIAYDTLPFTAKDRAALNVAGQILSQRILEQVREEWGASYSPGAGAMMSRVANGANSMVITQFPMKPEMKDKVVNYLKQAYIDMQNEVKPAELTKVSEYMVKNVKEQLDKNNGWLNGMAAEALNGVDTFTGAEEIYKNLTTDDIRNIMKRINDAGNYRVVLMDAVAPAAK